MNKNIGIFAGSFNPVHSGHIAFALQAMNKAGLNMIYFLPERRPRQKTSLEHYGHRVAMLKQALKPHPKFKVLELVEASFSTKRTLPKLQTLFAGDNLYMLIGSNLIEGLSAWPDSGSLIKSTEFIVGLRSDVSKQDVEEVIKAWEYQPMGVKLINSFAPNVTSGRVRRALRKRMPTKGILKSVEKYSNQHWLYISLAVDRA